MSKTHANRMIDASEVAANLAPIGVTPSNESQIRTLAGLEPEDQRKVWEQSSDPCGRWPAKRCQ